MSPFERVERFFVSAGFPALALSVLGWFTLGVAVLIFWPASPSGLGAMAEQFRVWCLDTAPEAGHASVWPIAATLSELTLLMAIIAWLWREPLKVALVAERRRLAVHGVFGAAIVAGLFGWLATFERPFPVDPSIFPAELLRTHRPPPRFTLVDQAGEPVELAALQGKVVMLTGVYSSCGLACPRILAQAKGAVAALTVKERDQLAVLAVTLDPEHDDVEQLAKMAQAQKVERPLFRLLSGEPKAVEHALDALEISHKRNPETGLIDHANVFVLIDKRGEVAYRLGLGPKQQAWLTEALRLLVKEPGSITAAKD